MRRGIEESETDFAGIEELLGHIRSLPLVAPALALEELVVRVRNKDRLSFNSSCRRGDDGPETSGSTWGRTSPSPEAPLAQSCAEWCFRGHCSPIGVHKIHEARNLWSHHLRFVCLFIHFRIPEPRAPFPIFHTDRRSNS